jgi:hypothetical protein
VQHREVSHLEKRVAKLEHELVKAHSIIDVQKNSRRYWPICLHRPGNQSIHLLSPPASICSATAALFAPETGRYRGPGDSGVTPLPTIRGPGTRQYWADLLD